MINTHRSSLTYENYNSHLEYRRVGNSLKKYDWMILAKNSIKRNYAYKVGIPVSIPG